MCVLNSNQNRSVFSFSHHAVTVDITPERFSELTDSSLFGLNYDNVVGRPNKIRTDPIGLP